MLCLYRVKLQNSIRRGISLREALYAEIHRAADARGITVSEFVRAACIEKLEKVGNAGKVVEASGVSIEHWSSQYD